VPPARGARRADQGGSNEASFAREPEGRTIKGGPQKAAATGMPCLCSLARAVAHQLQRPR
jgi:hypothetical protein